MALTERERAAFEDITERLLAEDPDFGRLPRSLRGSAAVLAAAVAAAVAGSLGVAYGPAMALTFALVASLSLLLGVLAWRFLRRP